MIYIYFDLTHAFRLCRPYRPPSTYLVIGIRKGFRKKIRKPVLPNVHMM